MGFMLLIVMFLALLVILTVDFLITAGLVWIICWAFSIAFSWKIVIGVVAIQMLISFILYKNND